LICQTFADSGQSRGKNPNAQRFLRMRAGNLRCAVKIYDARRFNSNARAFYFKPNSLTGKKSFLFNSFIPVKLCPEKAFRSSSLMPFGFFRG
jgi:hypothetical protein